MKVLKIICAVLLSISMFAYMMLAGSLFAIDLSLDENYIGDVLSSSDALAELVRSAELAIYDELEDNSDDIVEGLGGNPDELDIYRIPEANALFADIFTGCTRFILYGEDYEGVNRELVSDYLCAVADYGKGHAASEKETEDYLAVRLDSCVESFNSSVSGIITSLESETEMLDVVRFVFRDVKIIAIAVSVLHMLILILLIRGKIGYYSNAAVFGASGIALFVGGGTLKKSMPELLGSNSYSQILAEIFKGRFQLMGAVFFVICTVLIVLALVNSMKKTRLKNEKQSA